MPLLLLMLQVLLLLLRNNVPSAAGATKPSSGYETMLLLSSGAKGRSCDALPEPDDAPVTLMEGYETIILLLLMLQVLLLSYLHSCALCNGHQVRRITFIGPPGDTSPSNNCCAMVTRSVE